VALQVSNFSGYSRHETILLAEEVSHPEPFYQRKVLEEIISTGRVLRPLPFL
jgi:hypothetical protein